MCAALGGEPVCPSASNGENRRSRGGLDCRLGESRRRRKLLLRRSSEQPHACLRRSGEPPRRGEAGGSGRLAWGHPSSSIELMLKRVFTRSSGGTDGGRGCCRWWSSSLLYQGGALWLPGFELRQLRRNPPLEHLTRAMEEEDVGEEEGARCYCYLLLLFCSSFAQGQDL